MAQRPGSKPQGRSSSERRDASARREQPAKPGRRGRSAGRGRVAPPATRTSGRYTAPVPRSVKRSPRWYPWVLLGLLFVGVLVIILNYIGALPASPTNWYTLGGLVAILAGAVLATNYR